jgi:hypothetical protein
MWPETKPVKFIIWGHLQYTHTHSYIHYAFIKAAEHLGWDVSWTDKIDKSENTDNYLFLTEGQVDNSIPINPKAFYILHNCNGDKYESISESNKLILQVYIQDVLTRPVVLLNGKLFEYWQETGNVFYMPWATDLLPNEIDENMNEPSNNGKAVFVGSVGGGTYGNENEISKFKAGCVKKNILFQISNSTRVEQTESINTIKESYIAPAIVGRWQKEVGYIPCRIFKTISYGKIGLTNSKEAYEVVNKLCIYNSDETELVNDFLNNKDETLRKKAMEYVRDNHTYINRIQSLQSIFKIKLNKQLLT